MQWSALEVALALGRAIVLPGRGRELDSNEFNALLSRHSDGADVFDDAAMRNGLRPFESDLDRLADFELHDTGKGEGQLQTTRLRPASQARPVRQAGTVAGSGQRAQGGTRHRATTAARGLVHVKAPRYSLQAPWKSTVSKLLHLPLPRCSMSIRPSYVLIHVMQQAQN